MLAAGVGIKVVSETLDHSDARITRYVPLPPPRRPLGRPWQGPSVRPLEERPPIVLVEQVLGLLPRDARDGEFAGSRRSVVRLRKYRDEVPTLAGRSSDPVVVVLLGEVGEGQPPLVYPGPDVQGDAYPAPQAAWHVSRALRGSRALWGWPTRGLPGTLRARSLTPRDGARPTPTVSVEAEQAHAFEVSAADILLVGVGQGRC